MNRLSIRSKVAFAFFGVFVLISTITGILLYLFIQSTLEKTHIQSSFLEARSILEDTEFDPIQIPITDTDQWIYIWFQSANEQQEIYQKSGFPFDANLLLDFNDQSFMLEEVEGNVSFLSDTVTYVLARKQVTSGENGTLNLVLAKNNDEFKQQLTRVKGNMVLANLLAIALSLSLAYFLSGYSLKPIKAIIAKAQEVKAGTKMARLPVADSGDEIAQLSNTMNAMIARIEASINDQNRFFSSAAHELRTPLANMLSEIEYRMSKKGQVDNESLDSIRDEVVRLKVVVQDFLLVSQLKNETLELRKRSIRLDDIVYDVLEKSRPTLRKSGYEIKVSLPKELTKVELDSEKMESLILNLIDNAQKYGDNAEPIIIKIEESTDKLSLEVQNNISDQDVVKGSNLGLWVCQRIAELHGFTLSTASNAGKFTVSLILQKRA
ncbi:HAMP domain-containing sensor histidine kinase [Roseivirga misakiensis]|uniref:histidine kinase n=1 Tax=Roseivirga misakiensis TaxID=1563681 RepID=A0A1E5T6Y5_9BACT|nr:HAMP domain-containing sensor histidine kinase [Roseivirga misakiensis]OEK07108.1 hypothetical protein BFP71_05475 [Roseivirga misakiensis]